MRWRAGALRGQMKQLTIENCQLPICNCSKCESQQRTTAAEAAAVEMIRDKCSFTYRPRAGRRCVVFAWPTFAGRTGVAGAAAATRGGTREAVACSASLRAQ